MRRIGYFVLVSGLLVGFQNCSMESTHELNSSLSGKACEQVLKQAYQETYYPTFVQSCGACHAAGGVSGAGRWFASANFDEAFGYFRSLGRTKVETQALNAGHKAPATGPQHAPMIAAGQSKWAQAELAAAGCSDSTGMAVDTVSKTLPAAVYTSNPTDNQNWPRLSFNIMTEITNAEFKNKIGLTISVEVRKARATINNVVTDVGYEFRNPRALVSGTPLPTWRIKGLRILKNDKAMNDFTTYDNLNFVAGPNISGGASEQVMQTGSNGLMVTSPIVNTDKFSFRIGSIYDATGQPIGGGDPIDPPPVNLPGRVSWSELTGGNNTLNVFTRHCFSCHMGANPSGGLNLTDYAQASSLASTIQARMNNFANPMPPLAVGGVLGGVNGIRDRDLVNIWVQGGAPQN